MAEEAEGQREDIRGCYPFREQATDRDQASTNVLKDYLQDRVRTERWEIVSRRKVATQGGAAER